MIHIQLSENVKNLTTSYVHTVKKNLLENSQETSILLNDVLFINLNLWHKILLIVSNVIKNFFIQTFK